VSVVTGLTSMLLDESCLWIMQNAGQRAEWRCSQETCDFDCFVFCCWSLYISLLWFHVSLHLMLKFMYVHMYTSMHGSMTASNSCLSFRHLYMEQSCFLFFYKTNCWVIYTIQHLTAPIFNPLANLRNTTTFTNRYVTFSFHLSALQQYVNQPYQTKLKHNRQN
jgi:hypothetical protein